MEVKEHIWVLVISQTYTCKATVLVDGPYFIVNLELETNCFLVFKCSRLWYSDPDSRMW